MADHDDVPGVFTLALQPAGPDRMQNLLRLRRFFVTVSEALRGCDYNPIEITAGLASAMALQLAELPPVMFAQARDELLLSIKDDATRLFEQPPGRWWGPH
jgi:hypothetical protein